MADAEAPTAPVRHPDRLFVGGEWVEATSGTTINVIDSATERVYFTVAEAADHDLNRAVAAARHAFDEGPWPRLTPAERATSMRALGEALVRRSEELSQIWPRESGVPRGRSGCVARRMPSRSPRQETVERCSGEGGWKRD